MFSENAPKNTLRRFSYPEKYGGARPKRVSDSLMIIEALLYLVVISIGSRAFAVPHIQGALRRWSVHTKPARIGVVDLIRDARRIVESTRWPECERLTKNSGQ